MGTAARYRVEDGRWWIDIRVAQSRQLFDGRDPAPFRDHPGHDRRLPPAVTDGHQCRHSECE
jgi:hypothetical protein